jgi:hypothetical protein
LRQEKLETIAAPLVTMNSAPLPELLVLPSELYQASEGFVSAQEDPQLWSDWGYANGMAQALCQLGYRGRVAQLIQPDGDDVIAGQECLPWGKAYRHGLEMGRRETFEILGEE